MAETNSTPPPKEIALSLLNQALECGIRGANRRAVQNAIDTIRDDGRSGLTDLACKNLKYGDKPLRDPDPKYQGLRLQPKKKGNEWIFRFSWEGQQPEIQLGYYPETSLQEAREICKSARESLNKDRYPSVGNVQSAMTIDQFCHKYIALAEKHKRSWKEDQRQINRDILPLWSGKLACEITVDDAAELVETALDRGSPRSAEKLKQLGRFMFNVATAKGKGRKWLAEGKNTKVTPWFQINNPFDHIVLPERESSYCVLKGKSLKSYLQKFDSASFTDDVRNVLKLQLWCNTRISEPAHMTWQEVDLETGVWTIPAERTKTNTEHDVMLPTQAVNLLKSFDVKKSGYVFTFEGIRRENVATHIAEQIRKNRKHLGVPDNFTTHSLRHTGQTLLASMGCPVEVRDRISNHKPNEKTNMAARYNSHEYDLPAREWLQKMADHLDALSQPNVVQLEKRDAD